MRSFIVFLATVASLALPATGSSYTSPGATRAICATFGSYCAQAIAVARCESGLSIWAHNGQYLGLFQMGARERAIYGHGNNPWAQSRAAYRYFVATGRTWSPWQCKPW